MPQIPLTELGKVMQACPEKNGHSLDPSDWAVFREQAHRMLDDMLDYTKDIRQRAVWQPIPAEVRERFRAALPAGPSSLADIHQEFVKYILPFAVGNAHPGFMGW